MLIQVRINGALAQALGTVRLTATLDEAATIDELIAHLCQQYPKAKAKLTQAVPVIAGQHMPKSSILSSGQEVALLLPVAGG